VNEKTDVRQGTLALMILKTLETLGPLHGYGIARRIEQTSGGRLTLNYGTVYPAMLKLEQEGFIASEWGSSENNRKAKYYRLTRAGRATEKGGTRVAGDHGHHVALPELRRAGIMRRLRSFLARLAGPFGRARREREWTAEFESHLEMHIADNLRAGMSAEEARRRRSVRRCWWRTGTPRSSVRKA